MGLSWNNPWTTEFKKNCIRKVRAVATLYITPPTRRAPEYTFLPVGEEPKVDIQLPHHCRTLPRRPILVSPHGDQQGYLQGLTNKNQREMEKGVGLSNLGKLHLCLQWHPRRDPSQWLCSSADLNQWAHLARELSWQFCLIWVPSQQTVLAVGPFYCPHLSRKANIQPRSITEHSLRSQSSSKPDQRGQAAVEPSFQYHQAADPSL